MPLRRMVLLLALALPLLVVVSAAGAQEASPEAASPDPSSVPTAPAPTADPTTEPSAEPTPVPVEVTPSPHPVTAPMITPWPWPFPWMESPAPTAAGAEALSASVAGPPVPAGGQAPRYAARPVGGLTEAIVPAELPPAPEVGSSTGEQPEPAPPAPVPPSATLITSPTTIVQVCDVKAVEHGLEASTGAILQVAVRNSDCTWTGSQVLLSFDIRGPPIVDLLTQSAGLNVDLGVYVNKDSVRLAMGYQRDDQGFVPFRAAALEPLGSVSQRGDNRVVADQEALSLTGDAMSGSQRISMNVDGDARALRVLAQNGAAGASAMTGDAEADNAVDGQAGASGTGEAAQSGQVGDNEIDLDQDARARSGDALAGAQEIDVRVSGSVGELVILADNMAADAMAVTGDAIAGNDVVAAAGPLAEGDGTAQAGQVGDNRVRVDQTAIAQTGDALAGAQVIGVKVGGWVGDLAVMANNNADGALAVTGDALASNATDVTAGPLALASEGSAAAAQAGNNDLRLRQHATAISGTAQAGSQTVRIEVGLGIIGASVVMPVNLAVDVEAVSGEAEAFNDALGSLGPVADGDVALSMQDGHNAIDLAQEVEPASGDAVSGSQVVGIVEGSTSPRPLPFTRENVPGSVRELTAAVGTLAV